MKKENTMTLVRLALGIAGGVLAPLTLGAATTVTTSSPPSGAASVAPNGAAPRPATDEAYVPSTPREFYNAGTQQLKNGKLREAEASLETSVASQDERLQVPALYNLGHVRFSQGVEALKKGPSAGSSMAR